MTKDIKEKLDAVVAEIDVKVNEYNSVQENINQANKEQSARKEMLIKLSGKRETLVEMLREEPVKTKTKKEPKK